jgi:hypothetical protein
VRDHGPSERDNLIFTARHARDGFFLSPSGEGKPGFRRARARDDFFPLRGERVAEGRGRVRGLFVHPRKFGCGSAMRLSIPPASPSCVFLAGWFVLQPDWHTAFAFS